MNIIYKLKFLFVPLLILSLQSCFVAKDYERPSEIIDEAYYRTDNITQDSTTIASVSWRELFTDPILQKHIDEALENNIDIRIALQNILAAEAYFKQGKSSYLPSVNAEATYTHQELSSNSQFGGLFSAIDQYELSANLSWEADIWGKIRSQKRAFQASYLQSVAAHQAVKTELIARIASTYYELLSVDKQIQITQETIETRSKAVETTGALKEAGNVTEVSVKQTEAQLYNAQAILIDLKNQARLLENSFSILLGRFPSAIDRTDLASQNITTPLYTGVPAQLLSNRPDIIAAEYELINAFELTNVSRSEFYPSLTLNATGGFQSLELDKLFDANSLFATLVGGLAQPIFNKRRIKTQYEVSLAEQEQARLNFKNALMNASKEVSDALYNYEASTNKIVVKQQEFSAYNLATQYSEELLDNGLVNYIEVLNARENSLFANLDLVDARYNQLRSIVNLYEALGGGWQ